MSSTEARLSLPPMLHLLDGMNILLLLIYIYYTTMVAVEVRVSKVPPLQGKLLFGQGGGTRGGYGKKYAWLKNTATRPIFSNDRIFFLTSF